MKSFIKITLAFIILFLGAHVLSVKFPMFTPTLFWLAGNIFCFYTTFHIVKWEKLYCTPGIVLVSTTMIEKENGSKLKDARKAQSPIHRTAKSRASRVTR